MNLVLAVTGATGQLGRLVIAGLKKKNVAGFIALARSADKAKDLGVPVRVAAAGFTPTRTQRKVWNRHAALT